MSVVPDDNRTLQSIDRSVWLVSAVVVVGTMMSILDTTIVNVALETLAREFRRPIDDVQWVSTGYLLALATVIPLTGWMTERFGPKRVWMTSVALFVAGSVLCGAAWSLDSLIAFRVLQGLGGGMIMPVGMIVLRQAAGPNRMGRVMSVVGVPMLLAPVLGPVLGGLIIESISWRWIFYVNVPVGFLGLLLASRLLPAGSTADAGRFDWRGLLLLSPGVALVVFGLSEVASGGGAGDPISFGPIVGGLVLVGGFVFHALRGRERPLLDLRLFGNGEFAAAAMTTFFFGAAFFGSLILLPLYFQVARGASPLQAGLLLAPQGLGAALAMPISGRMTDRVGGGRVAIVGIAFLLAGTAVFTQLGADTSYVLLSAALVVRGIGMGATMMPVMAAAYSSLEMAAVPRATPALNVLQRIGGSVGTALLAVVLQQQLAGSVGAGAIGGAAAGGAAPPAAVAEPLSAAFAHTFWWALALTALTIPPAVVLARAHRRQADAAAERPRPPVPTVV